MITQRVGIQRGTITVTMKSDTKVLDEVVVTAQGLNRKQKALGYSCLLYTSLLNEYRIKDALHLLVDKRYMDKNVEEISAMVGFAINAHSSSISLANSSLLYSCTGLIASPE